VMGAEDAAAFEREYGERYTKEDLVSLSKHQIINKLSIDNMISRPFPAFTLGPAKSTNKNRGKVIKVSSERYAKRKKSLDLAAEFQANKERMDQTDEEKQAQIAEEQRRAEINKKAREAEGSQKPKNNKQNQGKNSNQNHNNQQNKKN